MSWSVVEDAVDSIQTWFKGVLVDGIVSNLTNTCNSLNNTFSKDNRGLMSTLLSESPTKFTGSTSDTSTPIWNGIETLTNKAIVPIAIFILVVVIIYELIQMVINDNSFRDFDTGIFFKWSVKAVCGIMLVSNVFYIATNIFALGSSVVTSGLKNIFPDTGNYLTTVKLATGVRIKLLSLGIGELLLLIFLSALISLITFVLLGSIIIVLSSRMIEIFMFLSISPIPMATMMNSDWGQIGKSWLRNIMALAFQGFFIVVALTIFKVLLSNVVDQMANIGSSAAAITGSMAIMLGYIVALIFTVFRSSNISKSAFAAQ